MAWRSALATFPPGQHPLAGAGREFVAQVVVETLDRTDGVGLQVGVGHVEEPVAVLFVPELHEASQCLRPQGRMVRTEDGRVGALRQHVGEGVGQRADRRQYLGHVAVGHHEAGGRIDRVEGADRMHVGRRLQPPAIGRAMPLQQFQDAAMEPVGRHHVAAHQPAGVARDQRHPLEDLGSEVHGHQQQALLRSDGAGREHADEVGEHLVGHVDPGLGLGDAGVGVRRARFRRWAGASGLPRAQGPTAGVAGQEEAERGRAGPGKTEAEQWRRDLLLVDLGVLRGSTARPRAGWPDTRRSDRRRRPGRGR